MGKPARSPVLGYNHNVRYHGRIYHVQTEDSGPGHTRIFTHLFYEGTILASKRYDYDPTANEDDVRGFMQDQHKAILKELKRGVYDDRIIAHFQAVGEDPFLDQVAEAMPPDSAGYSDADGPASEPVPATSPPAASFAELPAQVPDEPDQTLPLPPPVFDMPAVESGPDPRGAHAPVVAHAHAPGAPHSEEDLIVLDLDALPPVVEDSEPVPAPPTPTPSPVQRPFGAGVYVKKGGTTERPFERPTGARPVLPGRTPVPPAARSTGVVPARPTGARPPAISRPPAVRHPTPARPGVSAPVTRPPVVVVRPPVRPRPQPPAATKAPPGGVVVQRTVVVGGAGTVANRPRRPRPAVPYVVKEGSHPIARNPNAAQVAPPVHPSVHARIASPTPQAATISDKSLDEVILAYLSQDADGKR